MRRSRSGRLEDLKLLKYPISNPRLLDKSRALYRRACERDPSLSPLRPAAGKVEVKDAVRVTLPTVGGKVVYTAVPVGGWRFELTYYDCLRPAPAAPAVAQPTVTLEAQIKQMGDTMLDLFAGLERRVCAFEAKHHLPNSNVIHISDIAAE